MVTRLDSFGFFETKHFGIMNSWLGYTNTTDDGMLFTENLVNAILINFLLKLQMVLKLKQQMGLKKDTDIELMGTQHMQQTTMVKLQGCPVWGGGPYPIQGLSPPMRTCPPPSPKFWVPPHGDIGPHPWSENFGALRAQLVIIIIYFWLEANFGYIVILFNSLV